MLIEKIKTEVKDFLEALALAEKEIFCKETDEKDISKKRAKGFGEIKEDIMSIKRDTNGGLVKKLKFRNKKFKNLYTQFLTLWIAKY